MTTRLLKSAMLGAAAVICSFTTSAQDIEVGVTSMSPNLGTEKVSKLDKLVIDYTPANVTFTSATPDFSNKWMMLYRNDGTPTTPKMMQLSNIDIESRFTSDNKVELIFTPALTEVGEYALFLSKGKFVFTDEDGTRYINDEMMRYFNITTSLEPEVLPEAIETVIPACGPISLSKVAKGLNSIKLRFSEAVEINTEMKTGIGMYYAGRPYAVETIKVGTDNVVVDPNNNKQVNLTFTKGMNLGAYKIEVPAGMFKIGNESVDGFNLIYNVTAGENISLTPAEGPVEEIITIEMEYTNAKWVAFRDYTFGEATFTYADGTPVDGINVKIENAADARTILFTLNKRVTEMGSYRLNIPAGAISITYEDDTESLSEEHSFYYDIVAVAKPTILPRESSYNTAQIEDLQNFRLLFNTGLSLKEFEEGTVAQWCQVDEMGNVIETTNFKVDADRTELNARTIYLIAATEEDAAKMADLETGDYTFVVNADAFTFAKEGLEGDFKNTAFVFNYSFVKLGVEEILAPDAKVTVVSIDGKVILRNAEQSALNSLDKGLYIVNGHKFVIK